MYYYFECNAKEINSKWFHYDTISIRNNNCPMDKKILQLTACFYIIGNKTWTAIKLSMGWGGKSHIIGTLWRTNTFSCYNHKQMKKWRREPQKEEQDSQAFCLFVNVAFNFCSAMSIEDPSGPSNQEFFFFSDVFSPKSKWCFFPDRADDLDSATSPDSR